MEKNHFDIIVIGAGSGGMASGRRAAALYQKKVAIIENKALGGTCVNVGCVPKKVMYNLANFLYDFKTIQHYGVQGSLHLDFKTFKAKREQYITKIHGVYNNMLTNNKVHFIKGTATFKSCNTIEITNDFKQEITADHIIIASGSSCDEKNQFIGHELCMNSDDFFLMEELPKKMIVIGGGYIGMEMASIMRAMGVEVTIVCRSIPLKFVDQDITNELLINFDKLGIKVLQNIQIQQVVKDNEGFRLECEGHILQADKILVALGRSANLKPLNLSQIGIQLDSKGFINVDSQQNTNISNIYAIGDVTQQSSLTPVAIRSGRILIDRLFSNSPSLKMDYSIIPTVVFTHPPIGCVGMSEQEAELKYGKDNVKCYKGKFGNMFYSLCKEDGDKLGSLFKLICRKGEKGEEIVVGAYGVGKGMDEMIQCISVAVRMGCTKQDFDNTIAIHPTASEEWVLMDPKFIF